MREHAEKWLWYTFQNYSRGTWSLRSKLLEPFVDYWGQRKTQPGDFISPDIQEYLDSITSVNHRAKVRSVLRSFWNWLLDQGVAMWNPVTRTKPVQPIYTPPPFLEGKKIAALLRAAESDKERLLVLIPLTTGIVPYSSKLAGLRKTELLAIPLREDVQRMLAELPEAILGWQPVTVRAHWVALCNRADLAGTPIMSLYRTYRDLLHWKGTWGEVPLADS